MQALHDVVQAGYVRYVGMSSCHAWQCTPFFHKVIILYPRLIVLLCRSPRYAKSGIFSFSHLSLLGQMLIHFIWLIDYAINNKLTPFISMQNHYNMLYREEEREMMPTLKVIGLFMLLVSFFH